MAFGLSVIEVGVIIVPADFSVLFVFVSRVGFELGLDVGLELALQLLLEFKVCFTLEFGFKFEELKLTSFSAFLLVLLFLLSVLVLMKFPGEEDNGVNRSKDTMSSLCILFIFNSELS